MEEQLRPLERRESELDQKINALSDRDEDDAPLSAAQKDHLRGLRQEMRALQRDLRALEREQNEIDHKRDTLEAEAERAMVPIADEAIRT